MENRFAGPLGCGACMPLPAPVPGRQGAVRRETGAER